MAADRETLSSRNPRIAHLRRLSGRRRSRSDHGQFVVEGAKLVAEALDLRAAVGGRAGVPVESIFIDTEAPESSSLDRLISDASGRHVPVFWLEPGVLAAAADTVTPQPVLAIVNGAPSPLDAWRAAEPRGLVLVLVGVGDPGNAGTLIRSAEAVAAAGVILCDDTVDAFSPKTVRSSAGSVLRVPIVAGGDPVTLLQAMRADGFRVAATAADGAVTYTDADLSGDLVVVVGSEAHGVPAEVIEAVDVGLAIPMLGAVESLNAGVAGSLVAFESARQRR